MGGINKSRLGSEPGRAHLVSTACRPDADRLDFLHRRHVQTGKGCLCKGSPIVVHISAVIDVDDIVVPTAYNGKQPGNLVHKAAVASHVDHIRARPRIDCGMTGCGLYRNRVVPTAAGDGCCSLMGGFHRQGIVAITQFNVQGLEVSVLNAARHLLAGNHGIRPHAQTVEPIFCQHPRIIGRTVAVVYVQHVHLVILVHPDIRVDRKIEIIISRHGLTAVRPVRVKSHGCTGDRFNLHDRPLGVAAHDCKLIGRIVHARIESAHLTRRRIHIGDVGIRQSGLALGVGANRRDGPVGHVPVGLAGQQEGLFQVGVCSDPYTAV